MAALGVTAPQVNAALTAFSSDDPGGRASIGMVEQNIRVRGSSKSVDAIRNLTIPIEGSYVRLSDIAEVGDWQSEIRGVARLNGRPITAVQISKTKDESDVTVETRVLATIAELQKDYPDVRFTKVISTVDTTRRS